MLLNGESGRGAAGFRRNIPLNEESESMGSVSVLKLQGVLLNKESGQSLMESLLVLPFVFLVFSSFLLAGHHFFTHYLSDYWTYQSAFCLAKGESLGNCRKQLKQRLKSLPFYGFSILEFNRNERQVRVRVKTRTPLSPSGEFFEKLRLPVQVNDFQEAL